MSSINRVTLIGTLGADPELRHTNTGTPVANFNIATSETWNDANGQRQERTEWHRIVVWGKAAEACSQYLTKGRSVCVEGRLQTRDWEDRDGNKRYATEIVATNVTFLGGATGQNRTPAQQSPQYQANNGSPQHQPQYGGQQAPAYGYPSNGGANNGNAAHRPHHGGHPAQPHQPQAQGQSDNGGPDYQNLQF